MEKMCTKCKIEKELTEFKRHKETKDGLDSWCRACYAAAQRKWRKENPEKERAGVEKWRKENPEKVRAAREKYREENRKINREYIARVKGTNCFDCGATESKGKQKALELHHRDPSTKEFEVSGGYLHCPLEYLKPEIEKCDLLCKQCHAKRHVGGK